MNQKPRSFGRVRPHLNGATHPFNEALGDRKPKTAPLFFGRIEGDEDTRHIPLRNSYAVVRDFYLYVGSRKDSHGLHLRAPALVPWQVFGESQEAIGSHFAEHNPQ